MFALNGLKEILYIPIENIIPNPYQPRKEFAKDALDELADSIKEYGVIQPICVRKLNNKYELIAGERRLRAARMAGLDFIPAIIDEIVEHDSAIIAMIENLQREDLNFIEEAEGYFSIINDHGLTQDALAKKVGKKQSTVANKLRILKLNDTIKRLLRQHSMTERHARALLKLSNEETQLKAINIMIKNELNVKDAESLVERILLEEAAVKDSDNKKSRLHGRINYAIYINTIKNAYKEIQKTGHNVEYDQIDKGDYIEITMKIAKA